MKYFLDTEFLEGTQKKLFGQSKPTIDLISIGIVCEDGREYYSISKDFNLKEAWNRYDLKKANTSDNHTMNDIKVYWLRDNVLKPIYLELLEKELGYGYSRHEFYTSTAFKMIGSDYKQFKYLIKKYGKTNKQIAEEIKYFVANRPIGLKKEQWILDYDTKDVHFYGYYSDYDWVVFCWLFGKMNNLPKGFPMYCIDLKQTLDEKAWKIYCNNGTLDAEKDINKRIEFLKTKGAYPKQTNEHNALADAKWNFELYKFLKTL